MPINLPKSARQFIETAKGLADAIAAVDAINGLDQIEAESRARVAAMLSAAAIDEQTVRERIAATEAKIAATAAKARADEEAARAAAEKRLAESIAAAQATVSESNAKAAKAKALQLASEEAERKALANIDAMSQRIGDLAVQLSEALAIVAKAEAIKKAMG